MFSKNADDSGQQPPKRRNRLAAWFAERKRSFKDPYNTARLGGSAQRGSRRWILLIILPVVTVLFATSAVIIGGWVWSYRAALDEHAGKLERAHSAFSKQLTIYGNWLEPWRTRYNLGTVLARQKQYGSAQKYLAEALKEVPKAKRSDEGYIDPSSTECMVRINLSIVYERQGDARSSEDEGAARKLYKKAAKMSEPCSAGGPSKHSASQQEKDKANKQGKKAKEIHDRQAQKSQAGQGDSQKPQSSGSSGGGKDQQDQKDDRQPQQDKGQQSGRPEDSDAEKDRQRQLNKRNQESREGDGSSQGGWPGKPW